MLQSTTILDLVEPTDRLYSVKFNVKLAKPLSLRGRAGEGEMGTTNFMIQDGTFGMPVREPLLTGKTSNASD